MFAWIGGKAVTTVAQDFDNPCSKRSCRYGDTSHQTDKDRCSHEDSKIGKRKYAESSHSQHVMHPIDEILWWHNAIRNELSDIVEETRRIQQSGDFSNISAFNHRLRFIADVCIFHRSVALNLNSCAPLFQNLTCIQFIMPHASRQDFYYVEHLDTSSAIH